MTTLLTRSASPSARELEPHRPQPQRTITDRRRRTRLQAEVRDHLAVLEQATMAVLEGYLSGPLYQRAAHSAPRLLALAETLDWREGTRVAHAMARLFHSEVAFGLVQALHLAELLAAFYRAMARTAVEQSPTCERDVAGGGDAAIPPAA
jgi:hypothetical protein